MTETRTVKPKPQTTLPEPKDDTPPEVVQTPDANEEEKPTPELTNTQESEVSPLDSLMVNPTHFATNPNATL